MSSANRAASGSRSRRWLHQLVRPLPLVIAAALLASSALVSAATFPGMSRRLPASTDAIIAINIAKVLQTPYAKEQGWGQGALAKRPHLVALGCKKLLMGAEFVPSKGETRWEVTLLEVAKMPDLKELAQAEGGTVDRVWQQDAVVSPVNAYFLPIASDILAICTPAERSAVSRWVRQPRTEELPVTSQYIKGVLAKINDDSHVVMALDLEGAYGLPNIRRFLAESDLEELQGRNLASIGQTISTLNGLTLEITVDKAVTGKLSISFDTSANELGSIAKPLFIAVLKAAGMYLDDVDQWNFTASGKEVRGTGPLSEVSLERLIGIVQSPIPAKIAAATSPDAAAPADPAVASQRYFKSVCQVIDGLKPGTSMKETATWWFQASKRIDQFPILNVDPALIEWGTFVSMKLKELSATGVAGQTQLQARAAGVGNPDYGNSYYDGYGNYNYDASREREASKDYWRQRREAAAQQRGQIQQQALQILSQANGARQKIRADMTAKYKVEF